MQTKKNLNNNKKESNKKVFRKPKKDFSFLMQFKYVEKWLEKIKSKQQRLGILNQFCNFINKTPEQLILEHHNDIQTKPFDKTDIAKKQFHAFYHYLIGEKNDLNDKIIDKPISNNSAREYIFSKLASFYKRNKVQISFEKKEVPKPDNKGVIDKVWRNGNERIISDNKKKWLKDIIESFNDIKNRTIVYCKISSGLDDVDLFNLKVGDFRKGYYGDYSVCYVEGNRERTGEYYQTFFNSEACNSIELYFKDRERKGEKINDNSWLFVGNKKFKGKYTQMKRNIFYDDLKSVCDKLNLKNITPKSFRRWFNTELKRNGIDIELVERMMGHKFGISLTYQNILDDQDEFTKLYANEIEHITLLGDGNRIYNEIDEKIKNLEIINEDLKKSINDLSNKNIKLIKTLEKRVGYIIESLDISDWDLYVADAKAGEPNFDEELFDYHLNRRIKENSENLKETSKALKELRK